VKVKKNIQWWDICTCWYPTVWNMNIEIAVFQWCHLR